MGKQEDNFCNRLIKILTSKGYLVLNCGKKQIFDLVAMKDQIAFPIEVKAKKTDYDDEQFDRQMIIAEKSNIIFFVIRQSKRKGKMFITAYGDIAFQFKQKHQNFVNDLGEYIV